MFKIKSRGDFTKIRHYLNKNSTTSIKEVLNKYGQKGVESLRAATPIDSGLTASSWSYKITGGNGRATLEFHNTNINNGVPIAIILQYGHGTGTGGWVEGRDYINPAIQPIFDEIAEDAWKEVTKI